LGRKLASSGAPVNCRFDDDASEFRQGKREEKGGELITCEWGEEGNQMDERFGGEFLRRFGSSRCCAHRVGQKDAAEKGFTDDVGGTEEGLGALLSEVVHFFNTPKSHIAFWVYFRGEAGRCGRTKKGCAKKNGDFASRGGGFCLVGFVFLETPHRANQRAGRRRGRSIGWLSGRG